MKRMFSGFHKGQAGFTLVELLVVIGIIVALGAVIVPNVIQFSSQGETGANVSEAATVQAAMDAMMADQGLGSVTAQAGPATATNDFSALPAEGALGPTGGLGPSASGYLRSDTTQFFYCWSANGLIATDASWDGTSVCP